jgi:hypothetical protein
LEVRGFGGHWTGWEVGEGKFVERVWSEEGEGEVGYDDEWSMSLSSRTNYGGSKCDVSFVVVFVSFVGL